MNPGRPSVLLPGYFRNLTPLHITTEFRHGFEGINPSRVRLLQKGDQGICEKRGLAPETYDIWQNTASGFAQQLLVGAPWQRWQGHQKFHQTQIKKRMANFHGDACRPRIVSFK